MIKDTMDSMQTISADEMESVDGGSWWNDVAAFVVGAVGGWNAYQPQERVWSTISFEDCECSSQ